MARRMADLRRHWDRAPRQLGPAGERAGISHDRAGLLLLSQYLSRDSRFGYANQMVGVTRSVAQLGWCLLACASVLAVNVIRISLIGLHPNYYDMLHGPLGSTAANWLSLGLIGLICYLGVRRDFSRA